MIILQKYKLSLKKKRIINCAKMQIDKVYNKSRERTILNFCIDIFTKIIGVIIIFFIFNFLMKSSFYLILIFVYLVLAHYFIKDLADNLWLYIGMPRKRQRLTPTLGNIERFIYIFCYVMEQYTFIGIYFGIKIAHRLILPSSAMSEKQLIERGERTNAFLIGNINSLFFGLTGGFLLEKWLLIHGYYEGFINFFCGNF